LEGRSGGPIERLAITEFDLEELMTTTETSAGRAEVLAEIRTEDLSNTSSDHYRYSCLLGHYVI
jgi:hypothetical protein